MPSTGPNYPVGINEWLAVPYDHTWGGSEYEVGIDDGLSAVCYYPVGSLDEVSGKIICNDFGFSIPAGATIDGIEVEIERSCPDLDQGVQDYEIYLLKNAVEVGDNKAIASGYGTTLSSVTYGGPNDLWGTTWTRNDINGNTDFGVVFSCVNAGGGEIAHVDYIRITVYYTTSQPQVILFD